jgi:hypothetical protein
MSNYFEWLVRREKIVVAITIVLAIALVVQMRFCRVRVVPEANLLPSQQRTSQIPQSPDSIINIAGQWEMSVQKRKGGSQIWTLTLEQDGEELKGIINSEGGDLTIGGTIKGQSINLSAKRFGVTVEFPATLDGDMMKGTMRVLTVSRQWVAKRK